MRQRAEPRQSGLGSNSVTRPKRAPARPRRGGATPDPLSRLISAVIDVECFTSYLKHILIEACELHETMGPPRPEQLPAARPLRERRAAELLRRANLLRLGSTERLDVELEARHTDRWTNVTDELEHCYRDLCTHIEEVLDAAPRAASVLDANQPDLQARLSLRVRRQIHALFAPLRPIIVGEDARGLSAAPQRRLIEHLEQSNDALQDTRVEMQARRDYPSGWLTVTEAAELLAQDLGRDIDRKNRMSLSGQISRAATAGEVVSNGLSDRDRRIDPVSFAAYRLKRRDAFLDSYD